MNGFPRHCADYMPGIVYGGAGGALMAAQMGGTALSAVGSYSSAQYQAGVMKQNASIAQQNAQIAGQQGAVQQYQQGLKTGAEVGQQKAAYAGDGVNTQSASAQNVIAGTRQAGEMNQSMLRFNMQTQVQDYNTQASQDKAQASALSTAAPIGALGTILGGASSVGNQYLNFQKFGWPTWGTISGGTH